MGKKNISHGYGFESPSPLLTSRAPTHTSAPSHRLKVKTNPAKIKPDRHPPFAASRQGTSVCTSERRAQEAGGPHNICASPDSAATVHHLPGNKKLLWPGGLPTGFWFGLFCLFVCLLFAGNLDSPPGWPLHGLDSILLVQLPLLGDSVTIGWRPSPNSCARKQSPQNSIIEGRRGL